MASVIEVTVTIRRLDVQGQARLQALMDKNNERKLTPDERVELEALVAQYEANAIANAEALVKATTPELFDASGQVDRERLKTTLDAGLKPIRQSAYSSDGEATHS